MVGDGMCHCNAKEYVKLNLQAAAVRKAGSVVEQ